MPPTTGGCYVGHLRAVWSSLVVLCLLAAGVRPSEAGLRERDASTATIGVAGRHGVVTPSFRRTSTSFAHAQSPFVTPSVELDARATRTFALVSLTAPAWRPDLPLVLTRTSRGPPLHD